MIDREAPEDRPFFRVADATDNTDPRLQSVVYVNETNETQRFVSFLWQHYPNGQRFVSDIAEVTSHPRRPVILPHQYYNHHYTVVPAKGFLFETFDRRRHGDLLRDLAPHGTRPYQ